MVALPGPRQVGKTTLAWLYSEALGHQPVHHFDLESPADLARLANPELALSPLKGLVILDEIQRLPGLFPVLRVLADRPETPARFLINYTRHHHYMLDIQLNQLRLWSSASGNRPQPSAVHRWACGTLST